MITRVYLCLPMFTHVYCLAFTRACLPIFTQYLLVLTYVYSSVHMFTPVYSCFPIFTHVYSSLPIFSIVQSCLFNYAMFTRVYLCLLSKHR